MRWPGFPAQFHGWLLGLHFACLGLPRVCT